MAFSQHHCSERSGFCDRTRATKRAATALLPFTSRISRCRVDRDTLEEPAGIEGAANRMGNRYPVNQQNTATTKTTAKITEKIDDIIDFPCV